jgi:hypothetical protein
MYLLLEYGARLPVGSLPDNVDGTPAPNLRELLKSLCDATIEQVGWLVDKLKPFGGNKGFL